MWGWVMGHENERVYRDRGGFFRIRDRAFDTVAHQGIGRSD